MTVPSGPTTSKGGAALSSQKPPSSRLRRVLMWVLVICLILICLIFIIASLLWVNRYSLMEDFTIDALADEGIQAELSIEEVTKTQARLENIRLKRENAEIFSSETIVVDYDWKELREGKVKRIFLTQPKARLTLDAKGKIIDDWFPRPESGEDDQDVRPPPSEVKVDDGALTIISPFGQAEAQLDAHYFSPDNFTAKVAIAPSALAYKDWALVGGGNFDITRDNAKTAINKSAIKLDVALESVQHPDIEAANLKIIGDIAGDVTDELLELSGPLDIRMDTLVHPVLDSEDLQIKSALSLRRQKGELDISGPTDIAFASLQTAQITTRQGRLGWDGDINHRQDEEAKSKLAFDGAWRADIKGLSLPDPIRRRDMAQTLSLNDALSKTPIAQNFVPELTQAIQGLLQHSDLTGQGQARLGPQGLTALIDGPLSLSSQSTALSLTQIESQPLYRFKKPSSEVLLDFHAKLTKPAGLSLRGARFKARSDNGWRLGGVTGFSADISTAQDWRAAGLDGIPARLSPFEAKVSYEAHKTREMRLTGHIDYDGVLPGAVVSGLKTGGDVLMDIDESETRLNFTPQDEQPIIIARVDTDSGWRAEDVSGRLTTKTPIFRRRKNSSSISAKLANMSFTAIDAKDVRHLNMNFSTMDVDGELIGESQNWTLDARAAKITSEDTPGPGTDITLPAMHMEVWRDPSKDLRFTLTAPSASAQTQLVKASDIEIKASGSPADFILNYSPGPAQLGQVKFTGDALPPLPMTGMVHYKDEAFTGSAQTNLPFGEDTPIDVSYRFKDGAGTAEVDIPELIFTPSGLQPQNLVKALSGKIADVDGAVSAHIKLAFAAGQPLQSSGSAQLKSLNFGTLPGPLGGVSTQLNFSSFFPLQSQGRQTLNVASFDPGFPLENGVIEFELIPDGVKVYSARWPLGAGTVSLDPFDWLYSAPQNRVVMRVENVSIGEFINEVGDGALQATGNIEGMLPVILSGPNVEVDNGFLEVKEGGIIRYKSDQIDSSSNYAQNDNDAVQALREQRYRDAVFQALQEFEYRELTVKMDGPLDGAIEVGLEFDGKNKDVLNSQPFRFAITIEGELLNILRSFDTDGLIDAELARRQLEQESLPPELE